MKKTALILIVCLTIFASCKKTVESEKKSWDVNISVANQLIHEFPSFANAIREQIRAAETVMNQSQSISDEKMKIQKMADANVLLNSGFVGNLKEIKSLKQTVRTKTVEARGLKFEGYSEMMSSNQAISSAEKSVSEADIKLRGIVNTKADADALSSIVLTDLKGAVAGLDSVISRVKERENLEKKKTDQIAADKAAADKKKAEEAKPIKCPYCGTLNVATAAKCKSCGAPLKK
jgi:transcriptional regulator with GAF, ATPase, and Fis domain